MLHAEDLSSAVLYIMHYAQRLYNLRLSVTSSIIIIIIFTSFFIIWALKV